MHTNTDIEPVGITGSEFLERGGLDNVDPLGDIELTGFLEVSGISLSKLGNLYI